MKRDMELVRVLLLRIEQDETCCLQSPNIEVDGYSSDEIGYNLNIMVNGGLLDARGSQAMRDKVPQFLITGITWCGHEFLDSIRNDSVWSHTKEALKPFGSASFDVIKSIAVAFISSKLGLT